MITPDMIFGVAVLAGVLLVVVFIYAQNIK